MAVVYSILVPVSIPYEAVTPWYAAPLFYVAYVYVMSGQFLENVKYYDMSLLTVPM